MTILRTVLLASTFAVALVAGVAACGDDDDNNNNNPGNTPDGSTSDGSNNIDAGCDFNAFVTGLITNSTNATALPSEDLGDNCTDMQTPFPDSTFQ